MTGGPKLQHEKLPAAAILKPSNVNPCWLVSTLGHGIMLVGV